MYLSNRISYFSLRHFVIFIFIVLTGIRKMCRYVYIITNIKITITNIGFTVDDVFLFYLFFSVSFFVLKIVFIEFEYFNTSYYSIAVNKLIGTDI